MDRRRQWQEAKLGSYELFRRDDEMLRRVWDRVIRGLSMRNYDPLVRESKPSFGISPTFALQRLFPGEDGVKPRCCNIGF